MVSKENLILILRGFLIIIVPIALFLIVFLPSYYQIVEIPSSDPNSVNWIVVEREPNSLSLVKNVLENPFELKWYTFCFESKNTTITNYFPEIDKLFPLDVNLTLLLLLPTGEWQEQTILQGYRYCTDINLKYNFEYQMDWSATFNNTNETVGLTADIRFKPDFYRTLKPEKWALFTKFILTVLSWWAVLWLITRMIYFWKYGINKK